MGLTGLAKAGEGTTPEEKDQPPAKQPWYLRHLWQIQPIRDILVFAAVFGVLYLGYVLRTVTVPLLLALLLAYLLEPVVRRLERSKHFTRNGAVSGILVAVVVFVAVPLALGVGFAVVQALDIATKTNEGIERYGIVTSYVRDHEGEVVPHFDPDRTPNPEARPPRYELEFYERVDTPPPQSEGEVVESATPDTDGDTAADAGTQDSHGSGTDPLPRGERVATGASNEASAAFGGLPDVLQPVVYQYLQRTAQTLDEQPADTTTNTVAQLLDWGLNFVRGNTERMTEVVVQGGRTTVVTGLSTLTSIGMLLFGLFLTGFFFYFLSTGYAHVRDFGYEVIPHEHRDRVVHLLTQMDKVVAGFVRGRITIAIIQSIIFTIAYWLIGVPAPLIFGPLVGILSIVPYVALLGIPITIAALAIDNSGMLAFQQTWWWTLAAPIAVYFAGQAVDDYLLTPSIQGKATNMDVPTILFASLAGGILAGIYGLLLAIPVAACVKILLRELFWPRFNAWLRGEEKDFLPLKR